MGLLKCSFNNSIITLTLISLGFPFRYQTYDSLHRPLPTAISDVLLSTQNEELGESREKVDKNLSFESNDDQPQISGLKQKNDLREMINKLSVEFITSNLRPTSEQSPRIKYG